MTMPRKFESWGRKGESSVRDRLVESGIARRMLESIKKYRGIEDPPITCGVEDCDFRVEIVPDERLGGREHKQLVIEMPNPHPENRKEQPKVSIAFGVDENKRTLGADGEPLTDEQWSTIQEILREMELEKKSPEGGE